ncbi:hypothetical protein ACLVWU_17715 [Bdellovibrio sp. HCB290]|uniref:hypothetical protein n=1 Tax=Bdellovibrio sp. HCB290 TaxID=3394356 RepID=UPI0039B5F6BE
MSIIQVLVGFGLAAILGLAVAEMGNTSSKQAAQVRASLSRASLTQTLQSVISSNAVCTDLVSKTLAFGPTQPGISSHIALDGPNIPVSFNLGSGLVVADGQNLQAYGLTVEWLRAFDPDEIPNAVPAPKRLYMTDLKMKVRQNAGTSKVVDLKWIEVGKVYFVTTGPINAAARVTDCFGTSNGNYLCPNQNDIQTIQGGSWTCTPIAQAVGGALSQACGGGGSNTQLIKGVGGTAVGCSRIYKITEPFCDGWGAVTAESQCNTRACQGNAPSGGGGGSTVTIGDQNTPGFTVPGTTVSVWIPGSTGSGTTPSSGGRYVSVPIPDRYVGGVTIRGTSFSIPAGASVGYFSCGGGCNRSTPARCNNSPTF